MRSLVTIVAVMLAAAVLVPALASASAQTPGRPGVTSAHGSVPPDAARILADEVRRLTREMATLRRELAEAKLAEKDALRELEELRLFVEDHEAYGDDFARYRAFMELQEREARRREVEATRLEREAAQAERQQRLSAARAHKEQEREEAEWADRHRKAGFAPIGLDVHLSKMAFSYATIDTNPTRIDYDPLIGLYYRPGGLQNRIDFSRMTISGSVLNGSDQVRNIGVAINFFDESGAQVGGEIVQINNARPDVPYPFTSTIDMALDRPFASSSQHVLYAD